MSVAISDLVPLGGPPGATYLLVVVDPTDLTQGSDGSTVSMTVAELFTNPTFITGITVNGNGTMTGALTVQGLTTLAALVANGAITCHSTVSGTGLVASAAGGALVDLIDTSAAASSKWWAWANIGGTLTLSAYDDAGLNPVVALTLTRTGTTITELLASVPITGALTGNASTATALQTARTINGVSFDGTANISIPNAITVVQRSTDISESAGSATSMGLSQAVTNGDSWKFRWTLAIGSSAGASGGVILSLSAPTGTVFTANIDASTTGTGAIKMVATSASLANVNTLLAQQLVTFDASAATAAGSIIIDLSVVGFTGSGTVDLLFKRTSLGETMIVRAGSSLEAILKV